MAYGAVVALVRDVIVACTRLFVRLSSNVLECP